ncbi:hypothetical protein OAK19_02510 [Aureispira]|nr:hypothetical protein [Aureispira sp.]
MKLLNTFFITIVLSVYFISCGNNTSASKSEHSNNPTTAVASSANSTGISEDATKKITAKIVEKACACKESARREDGSMDIDLVRTCMGGKNSSEYVKELLGPSATDKECADAEKSLSEKMKAKCPNK